MSMNVTLLFIPYCLSGTNENKNLRNLRVQVGFEGAFPQAENVDNPPQDMGKVLYDLSNKLWFCQGPFQ